MSAALLDDPLTEEERGALISSFFTQVDEMTVQKRKLAAEARPALVRLIAVCRQRSGQSYKVRSLLYSLWNGKATSLLDILDLDLDVRLSVLAVCAGFGWDGDAQEPEFFYNAVESAFKQAGLWAWWLDEMKESGVEG